jgi:hypothetical protein
MAQMWEDREMGESYTLMDAAAMKEIGYLQAMERHFISYLAERYKTGEAFDIARLCDETLDPSGRLLGRVRDVARGVKGWEPPALSPSDQPSPTVQRGTEA